MPTATARAAFESPDFRKFQVARFALTVAIQVQSAVVGWQVYALTDRPIDLGWVGLAQFLPVAGLSIVAGQVADRYERVHVLLGSVAVMVGCTLLLAGFAAAGTGTLPIYAVIVLFGAARAFAGPASSALLTDLVPTAHLANAVAWNSTTWQVATIAGPAFGGALFAGFGGAVGPYLVSAALGVFSLVTLASLQTRSGAMEKRAATWEVAVEGLRYVRSNPLLLGAMSLDLFAVLLGGATALLPVFARDILHAGPIGFGVLRSSPAIGAASMAALLAVRPIGRRTGRLLFGAVIVYGLATLVFALSSSIALSVAALAVAGGADMISVVIRQTLVQVHTPSAMRGRVSAVHQVFVGASNELGEFESGFTAQWFGAVRAVLLGGLGTLVVVAAWTRLFPELRHTDELSKP